MAMRCSLGMRRLNPIVKQDEELWICSHRHHTRLFIYLIQVVSTAYSSSSGSIDHAGSVFRAFSSKNTRAGLEAAPSSRIKEISVFSKIIVTVWFSDRGRKLLALQSTVLLVLVVLLATQKGGYSTIQYERKKNKLDLLFSAPENTSCRNLVRGRDQ